MLIGESLTRLLLRKDPFMVEEIFNTIYHNSNRIMFGIPMATSVIQVALWDTIGKTTKQPIYKLLGGMIKEVQAYTSLLRAYKPKAAVGAVQSAIDLAGFNAVKLRIGKNIKNDEVIIKEVKDQFPDVEIMVDANSGYTVVRDAYKVAKICEKYNVAWLEEPIKCEKGLVKAIDKPGLGAEVNRKVFKENVLN